MNMQDLKDIKAKRQGTQTDEQKIEETQKMYGASQDNLNDVIEVMELFDISIKDAEKCRKAIQLGISKSRAFKKFGIKKADEEIVENYIKYASSTDWNKFALETLGEL